jgi:hypothetical protein
LWLLLGLLLRIGGALLVCLVILGLLLGILIRPMLILSVMYCTGCSGDNGCADDGPRNSSPDHPSSHHIDLRRNIDNSGDE